MYFEYEFAAKFSYDQMGRGGLHFVWICFAVSWKFSFAFLLSFFGKRCFIFEWNFNKKVCHGSKSKLVYVMKNLLLRGNVQRFVNITKLR